MAGLRTLGGRQRATIVLLALLALCFAQAVAQLHAMRHLAGVADAPLLPGQHAPICTDCVAHAPLLAMAGAAAVAFFIAFQALAGRLPTAIAAPADRPARYAFRSRAPPPASH